MSNLRMSATERLEQLRDFVAAHDRAPSRRTGQQEERSLGEWVAKHKNAQTPTGDAVRELLDSGTMTASDACVRLMTAAAPQRSGGPVVAGYCPGAG
ncbi:hypothetical protein ACH9D2_18750 [Kocuria sp. M4R2S49]|uniref:hypothetical protein n=1 Tax=Kocuria rhizosphaericola TaxID=3376284 RepID=UPI0037A07D85